MTKEQRYDNLYWLEASVDECIEEGANLDARETFLKNKSKIAKGCKEIKKSYRIGNYRICKSAINDVKAAIDETYNEISRIQKSSGFGSWALGAIAGSFQFIGSQLIALISDTFLTASLKSSGIDTKPITINQFVTKARFLIKRIKVMLKDAKTDNRKLTLQDTNVYINGLKVKLNEFKKIVDKYDKLVADELKKRKENSN